MRKIKRAFCLLLAVTVIVSSFGLLCAPLKPVALTSGGSWRITAATVDNGTEYGLDRGTYDNMVVRFWTGNDGTGTLLFTSPALNGTDHGGESGEITFNNFYPPIDLSCLQVYKVDGDDLWGCDYVRVYYTPEGGTEQEILNYDPDPHNYENSGDLTNHNTTWFNTAHKRTITYNGNGADAGSVAAQYLVWGTSDYLHANAYSRTGYTYAGGWSSTSSGPVEYAEAGVFGPMPDSNTTIYAVWNPITYSVSYVGNGADGGSTASTAHTYDVYKNLTTNGFYKTGYSFAGWNTAANGSGTSFTDGQSVRNLSSVQNATVTLHAQWTPITYTVNYNGNGSDGGTTAASTHTYDVNKNLTMNGFSRTGYMFTGWNTAANGSGTTYADGQSVKNLTVESGGSFALYAQWQPNTYTVSYNGNGSTSGTTTSSSHIYDVAKNLSNNGFLKTGYSFLGWAASAGGPVLYSDTQNVVNLTGVNGATVTLYAKWSINSYTISFETNGGTIIDPITINYNESVDAPVPPTKTGYTFGEWYSDSGLTSLVSWPYTVGTSDATFYAKWTPNVYTVTLNPQGGEVSPSTVSVSYNNPYGNLPSPVRTGYTFTGWYTGVGGTGTKIENTTIMNNAGPHSLYANWANNIYTVNYVGNGSTGGNTAASAHIYDTAGNLTPNGFLKTGHSFLGWATTDNAVAPQYSNVQSVINLTSAAGGIVTFYAVWSANTYTVTFLPNDGSGTMAAQNIVFGQTADLNSNTFTKTGYSFAGWATSAQGSVVYSNGGSYTMNTEGASLYAVWAVNTYTVSFNANSGTGSLDPVAQLYNTEITLPSEGFSKTGYSFLGWNTDPMATTPLMNYVVPAFNSTLYAVYSINQYTISFSANGGTGTSSPITQNYGTTATLPTSGFTRTGYIFLGWSENPEAVTADHTGSMTVPAGDVLLYAIWEPAPADYSAVQAAITLAQASTLPANAENDPDYIPGGALYEAAELTNGGFYPQSMFTNESTAAMQSAINAVVWGLDSTQQTTVNSYAAAIMDRYNELRLAVADYSQLDALIDQAASIVENNDDVNGPYTTESVDNLAEYLGYAYVVVAAQYRKPLQEWVDGLALLLSDSIDALVFMPADYTIVYNAWNSKPANLYSYYSEESVAALVSFYEQQINWNLTLENNGQTIVNGYAAQIYHLIEALQLKGADYTIVDNALKAIPDNDGGLPDVDYTYLYTMYTNSSVANLSTAANAVEYGKDITEQSIVNGYADAIVAAVNALVPLLADYTLLGIVLEREPEWPDSYYTPESMEDYSDAVADGEILYNNQNLGILQQQIVDDAVALINLTYESLTFKVVNYTVRYQDSFGAVLMSDTSGSSTAAEWVAVDAPAITGYTPQQATVQQRMTGTDSENIITIVYDINAYTVTFQVNGGTPVSPVTQNYNTQIEKPQDPVKTGYTFGGWYLNPMLTLPISWPYTIGVSDAIFYAKWTAHTYTVNYYGNSNTGGSTASSSHTYDVSANLTTNGFTRTGYSFLGWSLNPAAVSPEYTNSQSVVNLTDTDGTIVNLYAIWSINQYTVTFNANGGTGAIEPVTQNYRTQVSLPTQGVSRTGYTLLGWNTYSSAITALSNYTVPANNATLYAVWQVNQYTISFDAAGGEGGWSVPMAYGDPLTAPEVTREGYTFTGWLPEVPDTVPAFETTFTAQWSINSYTISFDLNGGTGTAPESQLCVFGASAVLPAQGDFGREHYDFLGWAEEPEATQPLGEFPMPAGDRTLYAVWSRVPVTLEALAGSTGVVDEANGFIYGLGFGLTTAIYEAQYLDIVGDGSLVFTPTPLGPGTGTKVELIDNVTGEVLKTYTIVIYGDVNGDSRADAIDADLCVGVQDWVIVWDPVADACYYEAADLNGNGRVESLDADTITAVYDWVLAIDQATGTVS